MAPSSGVLPSLRSTGTPIRPWPGLSASHALPGRLTAADTHARCTCQARIASNRFAHPSQLRSPRTPRMLRSHRTPRRQRSLRSPDASPVQHGSLLRLPRLYCSRRSSPRTCGSSPTSLASLRLTCFARLASCLLIASLAPHLFWPPASPLLACVQHLWRALW